MSWYPVVRVYDAEQFAQIVGVLAICAALLWLSFTAWQDRRAWDDTLAYVEWCERFADAYCNNTLDPFDPDPFLIDFHPLGDPWRFVSHYAELYHRYQVARSVYAAESRRRASAKRDTVSILRGFHG